MYVRSRSAQLTDPHYLIRTIAYLLAWAVLLAAIGLIAAYLSPAPAGRAHTDARGPLLLRPAQFGRGQFPGRLLGQFLAADSGVRVVGDLAARFLGGTAGGIDGHQIGPAPSPRAPLRPG